MGKSSRRAKSKSKSKSKPKAAESRRKQSYVPKPEVPGEAQARYVMTLRVLNDDITITQAAKELGMSREQMQTIVHRTQASMIKAVMPQPRGRPRKDPKLIELEKENATLRHNMAALGKKAEATAVSRDLILEELEDHLERAERQKMERIPKRAAAQLKAMAARKKAGRDDDEGAIRKLRCADKLRAAGATMYEAAEAVRAGATTLRRWAKRRAAQIPLRHRRGPGPKGPPPPELARRVRERVRQTNGHLGAAALAKAVPGVSRRQAKRIKLQTKREIEQARKAAARRVHVHAPGILRGFDGMHVKVGGAAKHGLVMVDRASTYLSSLEYVDTYDGRSVARTMERDFEQHGAPLVVALDNLACHKTRVVGDVLATWGVLAMYSPTNYPQHNGGCERKVKDCQELLEGCELRNADDAHEAFTRVRESLNQLCPRRNLAWCTPMQVWEARSAMYIDRGQLAEQVFERALEIHASAKLHKSKLSLDGARRISIKQVLQSQGLITITNGGWC